MQMYLDQMENKTNANDSIVVESNNYMPAESSFFTEYIYLTSSKEPTLDSMKVSKLLLKSKIQNPNLKSKI